MGQLITKLNTVFSQVLRSARTALLLTILIYPTSRNSSHSEANCRFVDRKFPVLHVTLSFITVFINVR